MTATTGRRSCARFELGDGRAGPARAIWPTWRRRDQGRSSKRIDRFRTLVLQGREDGPERSVSYHNLNAGKRCIAIDIRRPKGERLYCD